MLAALVGALGVSGGAGADTSDGHLVLIGGNLREDEQILRRIVELADPDGADEGQPARIAIVTAAASPAPNPGQARNAKLNNAQANGLYYAALFEQYGAETYVVPIDESVDFKRDEYVPANASSPEVAAGVAGSTGVFFGGGDQMRYVRTLLDCQPAADEAFTACADTPVLGAIRGVLDAGGVVAGVSAGLTIQQGADMVTGGESYQAWRDGAAPGYFDDATVLGYVPFGGLGFFTEGLLDSHFTTWGRQARMVRLAESTGHDLVVGVDETTALVYDRSTRVGEVIGRHGVSLLDLSGASFAGSGPAFAADGVRWSHLVDGDRIDFATRTVDPVGDAAVPSGAGPAAATDVWDSIDGLGGVYTLRDLGRALVASEADVATGTTYETGPQYTTTLRRTVDTTWWQGAAVGFADLELAVAPGPG